MAWANVSGTLKGNSNTATSPWSVGALSASVAANTRLICVANYNGAGGTPSISNITDSLGNTWFKELDSGSVTLAGGVLRNTVWSTNSAAGTPTISMTFSGVTGGFGLGFSCAAYSGTATTVDGTEVDIAKITTDSTGSTTYDSGTTASTTAAANELKFGGGGDLGQASALSAGTLDGTYTARANDSPNGNAQTITEDRDSGASGSTARATATISSAAPSQFAVAVFKLASTSGLPPGLGPDAEMEMFTQSFQSAMMR